MTIKLINRGNEGELLLEGRLDTTTSEDAYEIFQQTAQKFDTLVLNFNKLEYVSSAGLRSLKRLYIIMQQKGGQLILRSVSPYVMEILEMTGFSALFKIE